MAASQFAFTKVAIECDIKEESEVTAFCEVLRQEGFDQERVDLKLPKVTIVGRFPGSLEDCERRCRQLNSTCRVSPQ
jgi:hypothetical protein